MDCNVYSVIMAGGGGSRFWPLSRQNKPKHLLNLNGNDAMINETIRRLESVIPVDKNYIVTNQQQFLEMDKILTPKLPRENILREPLARNTAPCILYSAMHILKKMGDGVVCIFPSDHYITNTQEFLKVIKKAIKTANESDRIITIGINPTYPSTGYGYIKREIDEEYESFYTIERFVEKPSLEKAKMYYESGEYYWNSGMFVCKISVLIDLFKRFVPKIYGNLNKITSKFATTEEASAILEIYPKLDNISIDVGIMERLDDALVIPGEFGWNDVGSWDAISVMFEKDKHNNIINSEHICIDTTDCVIYGHKKLIATIGINDLIIVESNDAILVCDKNRAQDVKVIVEKLKELNKDNYL